MARYLLAAPLNFSGDVSSYLLCACVFLALPKVTREGAHVAITLVPERLPERRRAGYQRALRLAAGLACLLAAAFTLYIGIKHFQSGELTLQATQMPRWILAALAIFGFAGAALQFLLSREHAARRDGGA